jgi:hypothetical protein
MSDEEQDSLPVYIIGSVFGLILIFLSKVLIQKYVCSKWKRTDKNKVTPNGGLDGSPTKVVPVSTPEVPHKIRMRRKATHDEHDDRPRKVIEWTRAGIELIFSEFDQSGDKVIDLREVRTLFRVFMIFVYLWLPSANHTSKSSVLLNARSAASHIGECCLRAKLFKVHFISNDDNLTFFLLFLPLPVFLFSSSSSSFLLFFFSSLHSSKYLWLLSQQDKKYRQIFFQAETSWKLYLRRSTTTTQVDSHSMSGINGWWMV